MIPKKRPTDLYIFLWPWLTKPSEGVSGHPVRMPFCRCNRWIKNPLCVENRVSIHLAATWTIGYARWQQVRLIQGLFPIPKLPWTMEYMWKKTTDSNRTSSICKLREPDLHQGSSASRSYIVENGMMEGRSNFVDAEACASRDGWVLFSKEEGKGSLLFFFFSPFTKAVISLPHLESPGFEVATFSSAPTFPDCVVFVTHPPESGKISISICRPCGDDRTWNGSIFRVPEFFDSVESVAYMGGSFYCHFGCFYRMTSFNTATQKWSITRIRSSPTYENDYAIDDCTLFCFSNPNYLLEGEGELLLAYAAKDRYSLYPGEYDDEWFLLYKLDWKRKAWRNKGRLRGGAIFLGKTSFWISSEGETEIVANRVHHYSRGTPKFFLSPSDYPFGLLEEHREKCKICYHPCTQGLKTIWIAPPPQF